MDHEPEGEGVVRATTTTSVTITAVVHRNDGTTEEYTIEAQPVSDDDEA